MKNVKYKICTSPICAVRLFYNTKISSSVRYQISAKTKNGLSFHVKVNVWTGCKNEVDL